MNHKLKVNKKCRNIYKDCNCNHLYLKQNQIKIH